MEEIFEKIKEILQAKNAQLEIMDLEDPDEGLLYEITLKEPLELSEEEYHKLENLIISLHFSIIDTWETIGDNTYERKSYVGVEEYQNKDDVIISVFYTRVWTKGVETYFIDKIWIE